VPLPKITEKS